MARPSPEHDGLSALKKCDLIKRPYIDPPFDVGADSSMDIEIFYFHLVKFRDRRNPGL